MPIFLTLVMLACASLLLDRGEAGVELFNDTGAGGAIEKWGGAACSSERRIATPTRGGDSRPTASGRAQRGDGYRRLRVIDGDDAYGERCELGLNDHRQSPTALYEEGQSRTTLFSLRLPESFPLDARSWQVVMQMKQSQPSAGGSGPPALALHAEGGRWRLMRAAAGSTDTRELWSAPAERGSWTRFIVGAHYSSDPARGSVRIGIDRNADGELSGPHEASRRFNVATLKREPSGGGEDDGIASGESIPSHLRIGIYHDPAVACPPPRGCTIEIDNVQVVAPPSS